MNIVKKWGKFGAWLVDLPPVSLGYTFAYPFYWFLSMALNGEDWTVTYHGNGQFEYFGESSERELGEMEGFIGMFPTASTLCAIYLTELYSDGLVALAITVALGMYGIVVTRTMGGNKNETHGDRAMSLRLHIKSQTTPEQRKRMKYGFPLMICMALAGTGVAILALENLSGIPAPIGLVAGFALGADITGRIGGKLIDWHLGEKDE